MSRLKGQLSNPLLSVVMPAYNEQATIEEMVRRVVAVPLRTELIVVENRMMLRSPPWKRCTVPRLMPRLTET